MLKNKEINNNMSTQKFTSDTWIRDNFYHLRSFLGAMVHSLKDFGLVCRFPNCKNKAQLYQGNPHDPNYKHKCIRNFYCQVCWDYIRPKNNPLRALCTRCYVNVARRTDISGILDIIVGNRQYKYHCCQNCWDDRFAKTAPFWKRGKIYDPKEEIDIASAHEREVEVFLHDSNDDDRYGYMSNWYPTSFQFGEHLNFDHVEQWMMFWKAVLANDRQATSIIYAESDPKICKEIAGPKLLTTLNPDEWNQISQHVVTIGLILKFQQNKGLLQKLMETKKDNLILIETSPYDNIWGVGITMYEKDYADPSKWPHQPNHPGPNLLGTCLMNVREWLYKTPDETNNFIQELNFETFKNESLVNLVPQ